MLKIKYVYNLLLVVVLFVGFIFYIQHGRLFGNLSIILRDSHILHDKNAALLEVGTCKKNRLNEVELHST